MSSCIKAINDEVNERKRKAEKREAVFAIQQKLQEKPPNLVRIHFPFFPRIFVTHELFSNKGNCKTSSRDYVRRNGPTRRKCEKSKDGEAKGSFI